MKVTRFHRVAAAAIAMTLLATACGSASGEGETEAASEVEAASSTTEQAAPPAPRDFAAEDLESILTESASLKDEDPTLALLLALEANRRSPDSATEQAIADVLASSGVSERSAMFLATPDDEGCGLPLGREDGLQIFQVNSDRLLRHDVANGEVVDHGPAPDPSPEPCGKWIGDVDTGRAVVSGPDGAWLLGSPDGPFDVELTYARRIDVASREIAQNRVVFTAFDASGLAIVVFDATTGDLVAEVDGLAEPTELTTQGDGSLIGFTSSAAGGGSGLLVLLEAETGEEVMRLDLDESFPTSAFDVETGEVVLATDEGRLITVDIETGEVVADVTTSEVISGVSSLGVRPDGLIVIATVDMIEIVDRRTGTTGVAAPLDEVLFTRVQPDGAVMKVNLGGGVEIINVDIHGLAGQPSDQWLERACEIAGRDFTEDEWDELIPGNDPLQPLCA